MSLAMLNGWEVVLILMVVMVLFSARYGFQPDLMLRDGKRALFYFLMTLGAVILGCLLAVLAAKINW